MKILCPKCSAEIPAGGCSVEKDYALCAACNEAFRLSDLLKGGGPDAAAFSPSAEEPNEELLRNPPPGTWITEDGFNIYIGARTRSPAAFFLVPFACVWSGGSLFGIYGAQILKGEFDLFMSLFGLPFLAGSVFLWGLTLMAAAGKIELCLGQASCLFKGVGKLGIRKFFNWEKIRRIYETHEGDGKLSIFIEGERRLKVGSQFLNEEKRYFLLSALKYFYREKHTRTRTF